MLPSSAGFVVLMQCLFTTSIAKITTFDVKTQVQKQVCNAYMDFCHRPEMAVFHVGVKLPLHEGS